MNVGVQFTYSFNIALNLETAVSIGYQVADGLETAHNHGIIHRNLNSANILTTDRGLAKILIFGPAPPSIKAAATANYSLIGKPEDAIYYLTKSLECGFAHRQYLEKDSDFDSIRKHPRYKALFEGLKAREKESGSTSWWLQDHYYFLVKKNSLDLQGSSKDNGLK